MFDDIEAALRDLKNDLPAMTSAAALRSLARLADPNADFSTQNRLARLFSKVAPPPGLRPLRLALLGASTVDHLAAVLPLYAAINGFALELFVGEYGTIHQTVLDPASELYAFNPDVVWLFTSFRDVALEMSPGAGRDEIEAAVSDAVERTSSLWAAVGRHSAATILQNNADLPEMQVFGNYESNVGWSRRNLLTRYNLSLAEKAEAGVVIFDLDQVAASFGRGRWFDHAMWNHSKHAFSLNGIGRVAFQAMRVLAGAAGLAKKCLVLDLDNTLWGGVIGDDGLGGIRLGQGSAEGEAFLDFQRYVSGLKRRGVILAVCSKNEDENARSPFLHHADMALSLEDIAVFVANWENKADNIRGIAEVLDLGLESFVFFDDNPAERALVRDALPMVTVPEAPEDPSLYAACLDGLRLFETTTYSLEDGARAQMYRENANRKAVERQATDLSGFLRDLRMEAQVGPIDEIHRPRCAQLINKSNQFHLTTTRYTEAQLLQMTSGEGWAGRYFKLRDRFGDHGLVAVVLMQARGDDWLIDTWCMSCRVLSRGLEEYILNELVDVARKGGATSLTGRYIPTPKNKLVADLYGRLGFSPTAADGPAQEWKLALGSEFVHRSTFVAVEGSANVGAE